MVLITASRSLCCVNQNDLIATQDSKTNIIYESNNDYDVYQSSFGLIALVIMVILAATIIPKMYRDKVEKDIAMKIDQIMSFQGDDCEYINNDLKIERYDPSRFNDSSLTTISMKVSFKGQKVYGASVFPQENGEVLIHVEFINHDEEWESLLNKEWESAKGFMKTLGMM